MASGCDLWHVTGSSIYHRQTQHRDFINWCKKVVSRSNFDVSTGFTGYPRNPVDDEPLGWTTDEYGRFHFFINKISGDTNIAPKSFPHHIFQRYVEGDILVEYRQGFGWRIISLDDLGIIRDEIIKVTS